MKFLENKKIVLSPYTPLTLSFASYLKSKGIQITCFFDKNKCGHNIYKLQESKNIEFDILLIYNEFFFDAIYKETKKVVPINKIFRVIQQNDNYIFQNKTIILKYKILNFQNILKLNLYNIFQIFISKSYDKLGLERTRTIFITKNSIGSNLKYLYLYFLEQDAKNITMITNNSTEISELRKREFSVLKFNSLKSFLLVAIAKNIIVEQVIFEYFENITSKQVTVQLWHGVGLKKLNIGENIQYDKFISTSDWTNETNFKYVFNAKEFLNLGYPRNDILVRKVDEKDLLFCDKDIYNFVLKKSKIKNQKTILYMPTYRDSKESNISPLDLAQLNSAMQKQNSYFIIKMHPLVQEQFKINFETTNKLSKIIFYTSQGDIYPILKYIDILVTDYSSVAYDFLLLDRPIIFFNYDFDQYLENREPFLFNYDEYTPGLKAKTTKELITCLFNKDEYQPSRNKIKNLFFDTNKTDSCLLIYNNLIKF